MHRFAAYLAMTITAFALTAVPARAQFHIVGIGSGATSVNGVNDNGQLVGTQSNMGNQPEMGFAFLGGEQLLIPVSILLTQTGASNMEANGINNPGAIVGDYTDIFGTHGFMQPKTTVFPTTINFSGASQTIATGINDTGVIVGYYITGSTYNGFEDIGGTLTTLNPPGATFTQVGGINNAGQIVGTYDSSDCSSCGFLYQSGTFTQIVAPGAISTSVYGISNAGVLVGQYTTASFATHSFSDADGVFTDVDAPFCDPGTTTVQGANSSGELVGYCMKTVPDTLGGTIYLGFTMKP
jgi:uncharacterized membrane protein